MYKYILLFLLIVCFVAYCVLFRKQAKSLTFVLGVVWFAVEILTVLYKIVISINMEERLLALGDALAISHALFVMQIVEVVLTCLSSVLLISVVLCYYLKNRKKRKAISKNETQSLS